MDSDQKKAMKYSDEIETIFYDVNYRAGDDDETKERFVDLLDAINWYIQYGELPTEFYSERMAA